MVLHTASQKYLSTRGGSYGLSFEEAVLKGLGADSGLLIPEAIPSLPQNWHQDWLNLPFADLAFEILSLYISPAEIPAGALKDIIQRSYSTFRVPDITPTITLDADTRIHLLELFHGPTFAFKDVALQFLGNLLEFFLVRRNKGKMGKDREHLTVIGATSGDTGSAAIYGLKGREDVSIYIIYPTGKISPVQEAQMTTVEDENVHCLNLDGTFDDCQDLVKALFADPLTNKNLKLCGVNSINVARILAQITYYFASYFQLIRSGTFDPSTDAIRFCTPTGNFGDVLAGYFAKRMGLPISKLVVATNENDILYRFWQTGVYEKQLVLDEASAKGGIEEDGVKAHPEGVKETLSPAMDILVSSNFERLLWLIAFDLSNNSDNLSERKSSAGSKVKQWLHDFKSKGGFRVEKEVLEAARQDFTAERVSDEETVATIRDVYRWPQPRPRPGCSSSSSSSSSYILDPHSAIGVTAALRSARAAAPGVQQQQHCVALSTAHPAKFSHAVEMALRDERGFRFEDVLPPQFVGLEGLPRRSRRVYRSEGIDGIRRVLMGEVEREVDGKNS